jgi:hypothetical protein
MARNEAFNAAVMRLERRCHALVADMKAAGEAHEGQDLVKAIDEIASKHGFFEMF